MKIVAVVVVFVMMVFIGGRSWGQNLVPNPSFEDTVMCPDNLNEVDRAMNWFDASGTADYFNTCASPDGTFTVWVPKNFWGFQWPFDGNAYDGFATYCPPCIREEIGCQLISPLQVGTKYYVSFFVSLHNAFSSSCAANKLGAYFSTILYAWNDPPIANQSQVYTDSIITDTLNWVQIKGSFIADSNYEYMYLGNFFDDSLTSTIQLQGPGCLAYYFVDGVCVSTDSLFCYIADGVKPIKESSIFSLSPNPVQNLLTINFLSPSALASDETIAVYDVQGRKIALPTIFSNNKAELTTTTLPNGIYLLQIINTKTGMSEVGKFVKEE